MSNFINSPKTWEELKQLKEYLSDCSPYDLRLDDDKIFYELYRKLVPRQIALDIIKQQIGENDVRIIKNNFPYTRILQYLPNVSHYCLWSKKGSLNENKIKELVELYFPQKDWFYSERLLNKKSVPEIWHCHIFVKVK
jgi:hypothetical protein